MCYGGELEDGGDEKLTYLWGSRKCIVLKKGAGIDEVRRMVTEISGKELSKQKVWFSLKYDQGLVMALEGDANVRMFFKGNEEHEYFYVGESDGPKRRAEKVGASHEGRTQSCDHGVVCARSGRDGDDELQEGRKGPSLKRWIISKHLYDEVHR